MKDLPEFVNFMNEYDIRTFEDVENVNDIIRTILEKTEDDNGFFLVHIDKIIEKHKKWVELLPRVKPYYAVKCNPNPAVIKLLSMLNVGFDCASKNEIALVMSHGVPPDKIIFANPCKSSNQIKYARSEDVDLLTFDDEHELIKIKLYHPNARLILRIKAEENGSECKFNCKFGADSENVQQILEMAKMLKLNVIGVSFHVGSNCGDSEAYYSTIKTCREVFRIAERVGFAFTILDIGGGFPGCDSEKISFDNIVEQIKRGIDEQFDDIPDVNIISEPGRYFVSASHTLVLNIIGKKEHDDKNTKTYYLNDGIYGSFNCIYFDHAQPKIIPYNKQNGILYDSIVFGPTCDSIDMICTCKLPDLSIGEWVYIENFGAYTTAAASTFNGFQPTKSLYCFSNLQ